MKSRKKRLIYCGHTEKREKGLVPCKSQPLSPDMRSRLKQRARGLHSRTWLRCGPAHRRPSIVSAPRGLTGCQHCVKSPGDMLTSGWQAPAPSLSLPTAGNSWGNSIFLGSTDNQSDTTTSFYYIFMPSRMVTQGCLCPVTFWEGHQDIKS